MQSISTNNIASTFRNAKLLEGTNHLPEKENSQEDGEEFGIKFFLLRDSKIFGNNDWKFG